MHVDGAVLIHADLVKGVSRAFSGSVGLNVYVYMCVCVSAL